jgi:DNA modification methylase
MAKRKDLRQEIAAEAPVDPFGLQTIYCGDNLEKLSRMPANCVDLVYIDPPFNSNRNYEVFWGETKEKRAFEDRRESTQAYIEFMKPRCEQIARVLKSTGSFYYHCDWHASHYVKVMLDEIFGENNFQNEIIWKRSSSKNDSGRFGRSHDSIYFYTKSSKFTWNSQFGPFESNYVEQNYRYIEDGTGRRYRKDNLTANKGGGDVDYEWHGMKPYKGRHWAYSREKMDKLLEDGRIIFRSTGMPVYKRYLDESPGVPLQDVWTDIRLNSGAKERVGYPTQKPLPLLERIIKASSNPDDIVLDAFCGCGTALVAAQNLDRRWIGIDISPTACRVMSERLREYCKLREGRDFFVRDLPKTVEQLLSYPPFEFENWAVNALNTVLVNGRAIGNRVKVGDMGIDGRIYPIGVNKAKQVGADLFGSTDDWFPVQVKQKERAGRQDIDLFESAMRRQNREKGFFISFGFTSDAVREMRRVKEDAQHGMEIIPVTVEEILAEEVRHRV